jgi:hypothetical protein
VLYLGANWGLDTNEVKNHLLGKDWGGDLDLPALIKHLDGVQSGMWTLLRTENLVWLYNTLASAGYETQLVSVHNTDELYVRRPLEEA